MNDRLYRSPDDRLIAGVAGGMAEMWDLDPSLVRIGWVVLTPLTAGFAILVYIVMAIVVPEDIGAPRPVGAGGGQAAATGPGAGGGTVPGPGTPPATTPGTVSGPIHGSVTDDPGAAAAAIASPGVASSFGPAPTGPGASGSFGGPIGRPSLTGPGASGSFGSPIGSPAPGSSAWSDGRRAARDRRRAERSADRAARRAARGNSSGGGAIVGGVVLILIGAGVLAGEFVPGFEWRTAWPIGLMLVGGLLVLGSIRRRPAQP